MTEETNVLYKNIQALSFEDDKETILMSAIDQSAHADSLELLYTYDTNPGKKLFINGVKAANDARFAHVRKQVKNAKKMEKKARREMNRQRAVAVNALVSITPDEPDLLVEDLPLITEVALNPIEFHDPTIVTNVEEICTADTVCDINAMDVVRCDDDGFGDDSVELSRDAAALLQISSGFVQDIPQFVETSSFPVQQNMTTSTQSLHLPATHFTSQGPIDLTAIDDLHSIDQHMTDVSDTRERQNFRIAIKPNSHIVQVAPNTTINGVQRNNVCGLPVENARNETQGTAGIGQAIAPSSPNVVVRNRPRIVARQKKKLFGINRCMYETPSYSYDLVDLTPDFRKIRANLFLGIMESLEVKAARFTVSSDNNSRNISVAEHIIASTPLVGVQNAAQFSCSQEAQQIMSNYTLLDTSVPALREPDHSVSQALSELNLDVLQDCNISMIGENMSTPSVPFPVHSGMLMDEFPQSLMEFGSTHITQQVVTMHSEIITTSLSLANDLVDVPLMLHDVQNLVRNRCATHVQAALRVSTVLHLHQLNVVTLTENAGYLDRICLETNTEDKENNE